MEINDPNGGLQKQPIVSILKHITDQQGMKLVPIGSKLPSLSDCKKVNSQSGYWQNPKDATLMPRRWIIHLKLEDDRVVASVPTEYNSGRIATLSNVASRLSALTVRIVPAISVTEGNYIFYEKWEWKLLLCFHPPMLVGSSTAPFNDFDLATGRLLFRKKDQPYAAAALIALNSEEDIFETNELPRSFNYAEATNALSSLINVSPTIEDSADIVRKTPHSIPVYRDQHETDRIQFITDVSAALGFASTRSSADSGTEIANSKSPSEKPEIHRIDKFEDLIGIDPAVYRQINAALNGGKQHLMFYGPPGTGKTTLAEKVAEKLHETYTMITGSADWSSQDVIGGYQPVGSGKIKFVPGVLLQNFDRPLIIDELNRCDIDKVIGPLFTVLSGQVSTLPYRRDISDVNSPAYSILPHPKSGAADHEYAPKQGWRILATLNSIDKAALYQMSYALSRRFGWIYVDAPSDLGSFLLEWLGNEEWKDSDVTPPSTMPMELIWQAVNDVRVIGPAPVIDMLKAARSIHSDLDFLENPNIEQASAYLDGFYLFVLPMLDGIPRKQAREIARRIGAALNLTEDGEAALTLLERLESLSA